MSALMVRRQSARGTSRTGPAAILLAAVALLSVGATACSGSDGGSETTTTSPEQHIVSDAEVVAGLTDVRAMAATIVAQMATDPSAAEQTAEEMYQRWFEFEGTVRKNDVDLYLLMEDGLSGVKAGLEKDDADRVQRGKDDLDEGAEAYLAGRE